MDPSGLSAASSSDNGITLLWASLIGTAPTHQTFGAKDDFTKDFRQSDEANYEVALAKSEIQNGQCALNHPLNGPFSISLGTLGPVQGSERAIADGLSIFTHAESGGATGRYGPSPLNLSESFLGSYNATATPIKVINSTHVEIRFQIKNTTSLGSLVHLPAWAGNSSESSEVNSIDAWIQANSPGPLRETSQTITWTQVVTISK